MLLRSKHAGSGLGVSPRARGVAWRGVRAVERSRADSMRARRGGGRGGKEYTLLAFEQRLGRVDKAWIR